MNLLEFEAKRDALTINIQRAGSLLVAFSGGVDSSALLVAAVRALGASHVLAATADSPSYPESDRRDASACAARLGVEHLFIKTDELNNASYLENSPNRCYFCKTELFTVLEPIQKKRGLAATAYGEITDDAGDFRPGQRAAREHEILAPLREANFNKDDCRALLAVEGFDELSRKPASACLSSRVPYGTAVVPELLYRIGKCEEFLRSRGYRIVRVRHHHDVARIELDAEGILKSIAPQERAAIVDFFKSAGYKYIAVDLAGYRTGSLNEAIAKES
ncbi:MAG: ATP-dependent sacrificial sulfur transferase LarE [Planctomycetes bacterium]|nr:ATP-dependent sacrificial sulfur transferase LarE [Planctomycetota bacterium]